MGSCEGLCRKRTALKERRERRAEKIRMEEARSKMSARRLQRMKKVSQHYGATSVPMGYSCHPLTGKL